MTHAQAFAVSLAAALVAGPPVAPAQQQADAPNQDAGLLTGYSGERPDRLDDRAGRSPELQADIEATVLPRVRLTPPLDLADEHRLDLNGTWQWAGSRGVVPADYDGDFGSLDGWIDLQVPGHFVTQGQEKMNAGLKDWDGKVAWSKAFDVPAGWEGRRVVLRFQGIDGYGQYWVNGEPVGTSDSAFLPVELDITDAIEFGGENRLTLTLEKRLLTSWVNRPLGGIGRDVFLMALPEVNLARFHTSVDLDENYEHAKLTAILAVANQSDAAAEGLTATLTLTDPDGNDVPLEDATLDLPAIAAGETYDARLTVDVLSPQLWHAEHPNLYTAELTLDGGETQVSTRPAGFVEIETAGGVLKANGVPLQLKGTNYHTTYLGYAHEVPESVLREDIHRLIASNHNSIRPWPTPETPYFEEADKAGIFTTVEVPILAMIYGTGKDGRKGGDLAMTGPFLNYTARMLETYRSHPSVFTWGLANESPYYEYFERAAFAVQKEDPMRPVFFGSDMRIGISKPGLTLNDDHYPLTGRVSLDDQDIYGGAWDEMPTDLPTMFTEWNHVPWNNFTEIAFDPGIDTYFGHYVLAHVNETYNNDEIAGGFVFGSTPLRGIDRDFDFGYWTEQRRPNAILEPTAKGQSPVRLEGHALDGDTATLTVRNMYAVTDLADMTITYEQGDASREVSVELPADETGSFDVPFDPDAGQPLVVRYADPRGVVVDTHAVGHPTPPVLTPAAGDAARLSETPERLVVEGDAFRWEVDRTTGQITSGTIGGETVVTAGPKLVIHNSGLVRWPNNKAPIEDQLTGWTLNKITARQSGDRVVAVAAGEFEQGEATYTLTFGPGGSLDVHATLTWRDAETTVDVFSMGIALDTPAGLDTLVWQRDPERTLFSHFPDDHIARHRGSARRMGDPDTLDAREAWQRNDPRDWPHGQDLIESHGQVSTVDFRSTKFRVLEAALVGDAAGVGVVSDGTLNAHAYPHGDGLRLLAGTFHNGGTEFHLVKSIRRDVLLLGERETVSSAASFRLGTPAGAGPEAAAR